MNAAIRREFLGWQQPVLVSAVEYLRTRFAKGDEWNLADAIVVLPGRRAGRRLLELLVESAARHKLPLTPPTIETIGLLPEQLYIPRLPFADDLTQRLAWADVLRHAPAELLHPVVPRPPAGDAVARWMELGDLFRRQHAELAADGLTFADVARLFDAPANPNADERSRWAAMAELQQRYLRRLDALKLWDRQTARLVAIERRECATHREIILIAAADMNVALRRMLDLIPRQVTALIGAPATLAARFDAHGCLIPEQWLEVPIDVPEERLCIADGPREQAQAVADFLCDQTDLTPDQITIGVADEALAPHIQRAIAQAGATSRWGPGRDLSETGPWQLLQAVAEYLPHRRYRDLAALARHPDLELWLAPPGQHDLLSPLDRVAQEHLPFRWNAALAGQAADLRAVEQLARKVGDWLDPLAASRPLREWPEPLAQLLLDVYGRRELDRDDDADRQTFDSCRELLTTARQLSAVPNELCPTVAARDAIQWVLHETRTAAVPAGQSSDDLEILGWLELPLDDAPALVVTGVNEGFVPSSVNSDVFLPNNLRRRLGLLDNDRRFARDAYALSTILATRQRWRLIVGRRTQDGDPLPPSRLLFKTDDVAAARRALRFFQTPPANELAGKTASAPPTSPPPSLSTPEPRPLAVPITRLPVTAFRSYLECPYRFYLRYGLQLRPLDDDVEELDGRGFGNLAHEALSQFGRSPARESSDAAEIRAVLDQELNAVVARRFGADVLPAVRVQVEQLRLRLHAFAGQQAAWVADGWRIEQVEVPGVDHPGSPLMVDGQPFLLSGRIDRIDIHRATGQRALLDYKTSDQGDPPRKVHQSKDGWIDLQLPLYCHVAANLGIDGPFQLGFINLPRDLEQVRFNLADWSDDELRSADEAAADVIRCIRQELFWPCRELPKAYHDDFADLVFHPSDS